MRAHDFNNILVIIALNAGAFKSESNLSLKQLEFAWMNNVEGITRSGSGLTRQLLLFSRKQTMQPRDLKLEDEIETALSKILRRTLGEHIQLEFKFCTRASPHIHGDSGMIDQILLNLTVNARDAMPRGGTIMIETFGMWNWMRAAAVAQDEQARTGSFVRLSVTDSASQRIAPEILPRIFEPFFTTKEIGKGTGLGLATVFGIVQQHGGWINVESEMGRGTTFRIYFPRLARIMEAKPHGAPPEKEARGGKETILLAEDEEVVRTTVALALARLGYRAEATTAAEAIEIQQRRKRF